MLENNINSGERFSFYKLFLEKDFHIEIPIIQRDYAQGRNSTKEVRNDFLDTLYSYLDEGLKNRDLDFIYGTIIKEQHCQKFIPLDGQQRLTTLFLLHWYLSNISGNHKDFKEIISIDSSNSKTERRKSKFTYETRTSSREFCDELVAFNVENIELDKNNSKAISNLIRNEGWYFLSWKHDITIQSMLNMLDSIHMKFSNRPDFYDNLTDVNNPIITFLFLNLKEFNLTDDLYIKMNSRGKPLSSFENFKAKFEQFIGKIHWEVEDKYKLSLDGRDHIVTPRDYFSFKIDTDWANFFWKYRNEKTNDNTFDDEVMNFIRATFANAYASSNTGTKDKNLQYLLGNAIARNDSDYSDTFSFHMFEQLECLNKEAVKLLIDSLDAMATIVEDSSNLNIDIEYYDVEKTLLSIIFGSCTLIERVQFYGFISYLNYYKSDIEGINQWMRFIHNVTENTEIDSSDKLVSAIKSINKIIPKAKGIMDELLNRDLKIDFFYGKQVQEEAIKASLIKRSTEWQYPIEKYEKHSYFKGQIGFLLDYSSIISSYENNSIEKWNDLEHDEFLKQFLMYAENSSRVFDYVQDEDKKGNYLLERAVLTKGDYLIEASSERKNFLNSSKNTRDFSWKRLLRLTDSEQEKWQSKRNLFKQVLDDSVFESNDLAKSLKNICKNEPNDWRGHFIRNANLIGYCEQGYVKFLSEDNIILLRQSQQNHYHSELYSKSLFHRYFEKNEEKFKPFDTIEYQEVKSREDKPYILLSSYEIENVDYELQIIYKRESDESLKNKPYQVLFTRKDRNTISVRPESLISILDDWKYEDEYNCYTKYHENESNVLESVTKFCNDLITSSTV